MRFPDIYSDANAKLSISINNSLFFLYKDPISYTCADVHITKQDCFFK